MTDKLKDFITEVYNDPEFEGTRYCRLDNLTTVDLYLVFAYDTDDDLQLCCKIAYNCDDLQCDYDCDWFMVCDDCGDIVDTEIINCKFWSLETLLALIEDNISMLQNL